VKRKLSIGQITGIVSAGISVLCANWDLIGPHVDAALKSNWFIAHPGVKGAITGAVAAFGIYREIRHRYAMPKDGAATS
jgi:ABC-type transport system involved in cytochrome c biogenesis permease subunit